MSSPERPEVGSVWISLDKRDQGRRVVVERVDESFAYVKGAVRSRVRLPLTRLYRPAKRPTT